MAAEKARVTEAELAVLQMLWDQGEATIRQLADALYPGGSTSEYMTVQKLLERLEAKGAVQRDRSGYAHRFRPILSRDGLMDSSLREVADKLCEGSLTPLLLHLVQITKLSKADRDALRKLITQARPKSEEK